MKKKIFLASAMLLFSMTMFAAGPAVSFAKHWWVAIQGGGSLNLYENAFTYKDNGQLIKLLTPQGGLSVGYDITDAYGVRLGMSYGKNAGACNVRETSGGGFYPYSFQSVNIFADGIMNLMGVAGKISAFRPKLYAGLGLAHTFKFTDSHHPWQTVTQPNTAFGFRLGFIAEYNFHKNVGIFADLCGEAYLDNYNGLKPTKEVEPGYEGYGGFPLDLRGLASLGMIFHF